MDDVIVRAPVCPATQGFVKNAWYVIAFSREVGGGSLLRRQCCDDDLVLFRSQSGEAVALYDRCPHRGVPLSQGRVVEGAVQCAYHGLEFGKDGMCTRIPTQPTIPQQMRVHSYPLVERAQFIWIWPGDPAKADPSLLPDHHRLGLEREGWSVQPYFMLEIRSNYSMLFENLLDTSHISFLHGRAIDSGRMATASFRTEHDGNVMRLIRSLKDDMPNENNAKQYSLELGVPFHRELTSEAQLPNLHVIRNEFTFPSRPGHDEHVRINVMPITPATSRLHYHFLTMTSSYKEDHPQSLQDAMESVLSEDKVVLEAIQELYDRRGPDLPEVSVKADEAAMRARRIIAGMVEEERRAG
jgi:phenylpropionate dioxygenase-like ring-hydroxylating dioxygenase large terminal subunit